MRSTEQSIILALDVPSVEDAESLANQVAPAVDFFKIGLELLFCGGLELARRLQKRGFRIMIDSKLHDIPRTVQQAASQIALSGADFLTVHAVPGVVDAAVKGCTGHPTGVLAVTVLTSHPNDGSSSDDLPAQSNHDADIEHQQPSSAPLLSLVEQRTQCAMNEGAAGCVLSSWELARLRKKYPTAVLVTPGIRPQGHDWGDQRRVATPRQAWSAGADFLVVGRPIVTASDPLKAAYAIRDEWRLAYDDAQEQSRS